MDEYNRRRRDFRYETHLGRSPRFGPGPASAPPFTYEPPASSNSLDHRFSASAYDYLPHHGYNFNRRGSAPSGKFFSMSGPDNFYGSSGGLAGGGSFDGGEPMPVENGPRNNLIVNYLPQNMTDKDLYSLFSTFGPVESCRVMRDYKSGYSYGFGFVKFVREEDALAAIGGRDGFAVQNKRLKVSFARPSSDAIKGTNLYVSNLPHEITEYQLEVIFGKYGRIVQKNILRDKMGICRGVAFVRFDRREEAQEAISALNNVIPEGGKKPLSVRVAEEHGKLKASTFSGWNSNANHNRGLHYNPNPQMHPCPPYDDYSYQNMPMGCGHPVNGHDRRHYRVKGSDIFSHWPYRDFGPQGSQGSPLHFNMMNTDYVPNFNGGMKNVNVKSRMGNRNHFVAGFDKTNRKNKKWIGHQNNAQDLKN